jgi:hypothetical protein
MRIKRGRMIGVVLWLVRWTPRAGAVDFCLASAAF